MNFRLIGFAFSILALLLGFNRCDAAIQSPLLSYDEVQLKLQKMWDVPPAIFDKVHQMVKGKFPQEENSLKMAIMILDLGTRKSHASKNRGVNGLRKNIYSIVNSYENSKSWESAAKEAGMANATELNDRAEAILRGQEFPLPHNSETKPAVPDEEPVIVRFEKELSISRDLYQKIKDQMPPGQKSDTVKIILLAINHVYSREQSGQMKKEDHDANLLSAANDYVQQKKEGKGWGELSLAAGFKNGGEVNDIKVALENGQKIEWQALKKSSE